MFKRELRFVVTEDCNYNCTFCHKEGMKKYEKIKLTGDDFAYLFDFCKQELGWDEVTLTGGEPFFRKDIDEIISKLYEKGAKITVVTNGELLNRHVESLKHVNRINLSIHSLDKECYDSIVQKRDKLTEVLKNISAIRKIYPNLDIRLNKVNIKSEGLGDIKQYIEFAKRINASIKFVELFSDNKDEIITLNEISEYLMKLGFKYKGISNISKQELTDGETTIVLSRIFCANAIMQIDPEKYCNKYNDLFITPEGNINICRNSKDDIPIYEEIKERNDIKLRKKLDMALNNIGKNCILCREKKKLAINGGIPIFLNKEEGKYVHPKITKNIEKAVVDQLYKEISIYDNSGIIKEFEANVANYFSRKHALTFSSGTAALWAMYDGIGLKSGDEIICPSYTFFATVSPILFTGAIPILVDSDKYGNMDFEKVKEKINDKTKAIVVTHMWGYPCNMEELRKIADENNLFLLEDCSHAHGAKYKGKLCGSWGDAAVFSLQGQKIISGGEGGVLVTDNDKVKERALLLGHYNKRCKNEISKSSEYYDYCVTGKGMKLRAHPIAIRIANEYFKELDKMKDKRNEYAKLVIKELKEITGLTVLEPDKNCENSWYAIILKYNTDQMYGVSRKKFVEAVQKEGALDVDIPESTCPLNKLQLFKTPKTLFENSEFSYENKEFEKSNEFYNTIIKIPVWYDDDDKIIGIKYIRAIKKVCNNIKELL